jgi:hypothetical protein
LEVLSYRTVGVVVNEVEFHTPRRGTKDLHAKIGQLLIEKDFLQQAFAKI